LSCSNLDPQGDGAKYRNMSAKISVQKESHLI
jgi:hypothetical protein